MTNLPRVLFHRVDTNSSVESQSIEEAFRPVLYNVTSIMDKVAHNLVPNEHSISISFLAEAYFFNFVFGPLVMADIYPKIARDKITEKTLS
jgi:hypothetical protein